MPVFRTQKYAVTGAPATPLMVMENGLGAEDKEDGERGEKLG